MSLSQHQTSSASGQHESNDHVHALNRLLETLRDSDIPGPQLFRLDKEFKQILGQGSEGNVRGINKDCAKDYSHKAGSKVLKRWPLDAVAIKCHQKPASVSHSVSRSSRDDLANRICAAQREVLTLIPDRFRGNPNIVQLKGWGLCLDTIENAQSQCCGSIQMPLLVLERAYKNLYEFLQEDLFPIEISENELDPGRLEEGRTSGPNRTNASSERQEIGTVRRYLEAAARWTGFGPDPNEVIRALCVDIGRGLESLHRADFAHGDLKPQNVLIFRTGPRWTAKLCDFGCTQRQTDSPNSRDFHYRGTKAWHPPTREISGHLSQRDLQRCDVYVYGLLVWSTFYLRGEPPTRPNQAEAIRGTRELFGEDLSWCSGKSHLLAVSIDKVFESTLCTAPDRTLRPWVHLDHSDAKGGDREDELRNHQRGLENASRMRHSIRTSYHLRPPLTKELKAAYTVRNWWLQRDRSTQGVSAERGSDTTPVIIQNQTGSFIPALSSVLDVDDINYSMDLFMDKHRNDIGPLVNEMNKIMRLPQRLESTVALYCCARFRSRVPFAWWQDHNYAKVNLLNQALQCTPAVDICTLAWLCKGSVGNDEIETLPTEYQTWRVVLHPTSLNESERLDRFLLLLEFGARVERDLDLPIDLGFGKGFKSILVWYLRSCRKSILPFVIREIGLRWDAVEHSGCLFPTTAAHLSGRDTTQTRGKASKLVKRTMAGYEVYQEGRNVTAELSSFFGPKIADLWERYVHGDGNRLTGDDPETDTTGHDFLANEERDAATETTRLFHPRSTRLPLGWKKQHKNRTPFRKDGNCYFEDEATGSITLTKPTISFIKLRQVKIGFLDDTQGPATHLDLSQYTASRLVMASQHALEEEAQTRFPLYDEDWFAIERETPHPCEDVLGGIRDIRSFAERIVISSALSTLAETVGAVLVRISTFLMLGVCAAILLAGVGLALLGLWTALPLLVVLVLGYMVWNILLLCGLCLHLDENMFDKWRVIATRVAALLAVVLFYFLMQEPCPEGPLGTMPSGETCHRCWWVIWSFFRCRVS